MKNRESIEWVASWIEKANEDVKRILIIGDSVMRQCRSSLNNLTVRDGYIADVVSMSYGLFDPMTEETINSFLKNGYAYEYILFNLGGHHGFCWIGGAYHEEAYSQRLDGILQQIRGKCRHLITVSGLKENIEDSDGEVVRKNNEELMLRNACMEKISAARGYQYIELNNLIETYHFIYTDRQHFTKREYEIMAVFMYNAMFRKNIKSILKPVHSLAELKKYLTGSVAVYGDGEWGKIVNDFLKKFGYKGVSYIISDEYWRDDVKAGKIKFSDFLNSEDRDKTQVLVTVIDEYPVCQKLLQCSITYITLEESVYTSMKQMAVCRDIYEW